MIFVQTKISISILLMDIPCAFDKFESPCYPNILIAQVAFIIYKIYINESWMDY
jgi:hypothetical protein